MKCSASPTTCTARDAHARNRELSARFEALLFRAALAPLGKSLGLFGDVAIDALALATARAHESRLRALIERGLESTGDAR